jgi:chromate reductase
MSDSITILGIAGSLRERSFNRALLRAAAELAEGHVHVEIASIQGIPLYDGDLESSEGVPAIAAELRERVAGADGLLLASPEYNNSLPGVLKNAIDWLTRPPSEVGRVFGDLPVGLVGATPGAGGTRLAQTAWLPVLRTLGMRPWYGKSLYVARAGSDPEMRKRVGEYVQGFAAHVARHGRRR